MTVRLGACAPPSELGLAPTRLLVIAPATGQGPQHWQSFIERLARDPRSHDIAWMVFDHRIKLYTAGSAYDYAAALEACIAEKASDPRFKTITLVGHSVGGMLARRAYLKAAGATAQPASSTKLWSDRVDRILLFTSVNKGVPMTHNLLHRLAGWLLRTIPHPRFLLEDMFVGSDFIADTRIAWIRHFGRLSTRHAEPGALRPPFVVQFWGQDDSVVSARDNADLEAFRGEKVLEAIPGAQHRDVQRFEPAFCADPDGRWRLVAGHVLDPVPALVTRSYPPQRILLVLRGIRDSTVSDWVEDLAARASATDCYGPGNVICPEYGYFSAAQFAFRPIRARNIPSFRDIYAQRLAENPNTEFDVIAHSNGTYIFGHGALSTPAMSFRNVVLAAPVLPAEFPWRQLFNNGQVRNVRYDTASRDWPVGILCPALRALGYRDIGPAGLVLFGTPTQMGDGRVRSVGWYRGGHGAALAPNNRAHLLRFATDGTDLQADEALLGESGLMSVISRMTPYLVWLVLPLLAVLAAFAVQTGSVSALTLAIGVGVLFCLIYVLLDSV